MNELQQRINQLEAELYELREQSSDLLDLATRMSQELQDFLDEAKKAGSDLTGVKELITECDEMNKKFFTPWQQQCASNDTVELACLSEEPEPHYFIKQAL